MTPVINSIKAYAAVLTKTDGKKSIVKIDEDREYVWDAVFEDLNERHGLDILDGLTTRRARKATANKLGYQVHQGTFGYES
jgi:hypothetical protein